MNTYFLYITMEVFNFHDVWQPILSILTRGSFALNVKQSPNSPVLTHILAPLRATCIAARAMIPAPTKLEPKQLFIEGAKTGNIDLCNLAEEYGNKDYALALRNAVIGGYDNIIDLIFDKLEEKLIEDDEISPIPLSEALEHNRLDICIKLLENTDTSHGNINYYMSYGAAKGGHIDMIEWINREYELDYNGLLFGAISGNHAEICDMAMKSGQVDILDVMDLISTSKKIEKYAHFRDCMKRHGRIDADIYRYFMQAVAIQRHEDIAKILHQWSVEDNCRMDHQVLTDELIEMFIDDDDSNGYPIFFHADERMCNVIHEFSKLDGYAIDYNDLISTLGTKAKYAISTIRRWAKEDKYEITEEIDDSEEEEDFEKDWDSFGSRRMREIYYKIRTWDDLIKANTDYLRGITSETYHYNAPFRRWDAELSEFESDLIRLHEEYKILVPNTLELKHWGQQRKFKFICPAELGHKLIPKLLEMEEVYISARLSTKTNGIVFYTNIPKNIMSSIADKNFYSDEGDDKQSMAEMEAGGYPNIQRLFRKCYHVFITFREFPQTADVQEITTVLLDILQELDA